MNGWCLCKSVCVFVWLTFYGGRRIFRDILRHRTTHTHTHTQPNTCEIYRKHYLLIYSPISLPCDTYTHIYTSTHARSTRSLRIKTRSLTEKKCRTLIHFTAKEITKFRFYPINYFGNRQYIIRLTLNKNRIPK